MQARNLRRGRAVWLAAVAVLSAGPATWAQTPRPTPAGAGWRLERASDAMQYYERPAEGNEALREAFASTLVDAPPEQVLRALRDYSSFPEWSPYTQETRLVGQDGEQAELVFQRMDLPWPAGDRYFTLRFEVYGPLPAGALELRWDLAPPTRRVPCEDCGVEMPMNRGVWTLWPHEGGRRTVVTCQALSDPGGRLPKWAVRAANGRMFPKLLAALRERALLPRYAATPAPAPPK